MKIEYSLLLLLLAIIGGCMYGEYLFRQHEREQKENTNSDNATNYKS